jgi:hypothetical protein
MRDTATNKGTKHPDPTPKMRRHTSKCHVMIIIIPRRSHTTIRQVRRGRGSGVSPLSFVPVSSPNFFLPARMRALSFSQQTTHIPHFAWWTDSRPETVSRAAVKLGQEHFRKEGTLRIKAVSGVLDAIVESISAEVGVDNTPYKAF